MQAGGKSPFEHLSSTALLLQKRGGCPGAGSSRCRQRGRTGCNVCSVQSQQLFVVESATNSRGPVVGEGFSPTLFPRLRACNPPLPLSPRLSKHNPFRPRLEERAPSLSPHPIHGQSLRRGRAGAVCVCNPAPPHLPTGDPGAVPSAALQTRPIGLCSS